MIRHHVFDIGNVILKFDFTVAATRVADRCTVGESEILPLLEPMHRDLETGQMSAEAFLAEAIRRVGFDGPEADFLRAFQDIFTLDELIADLIAALDAEGLLIYLLSNTSDLHVSWFTREFSVFDRFDDAVYSHRAGCMKPDAKIFHIARDQFGIDPAETCYIDDLPANVEAARAAGFQALLYDHRDHSDFRARYDALH